jgi:hypothetical protein
MKKWLLAFLLAILLLLCGWQCKASAWGSQIAIAGGLASGGAQYLQ